MAEAPPTNQYEAEAVFQGISGEEALRSIAISLKRIADALELSNDWGEVGVQDIAGALSRASL